MSATFAVGTDVIAVDRVRRLLASGKERFLAKWFTPKEIAYCLARCDPARHLAGRLAAKESVAKTLGSSWTGPLPWRDIEVTTLACGPPGIVLHGRVRELAQGLDFVLSISHTDRVSTAAVIAWRR